MQFLWLTHAQARAIADHARAETPCEACGMLGGINGQVSQVVPVRNIAADPVHYYELDGAGMLKALNQFEESGLELLGFYHSHPVGEPIPSQTDIREATYPDSAYLIVGLRGHEPQFAAWQIRHGRVDALPLYVGVDAPQVEAKTLSKTQRFAIIVSALLAFILMIGLSIYLLPPAPEIPIR